MAMQSYVWVVKNVRDARSLLLTHARLPHRLHNMYMYMYMFMYIPSTRGAVYIIQLSVHDLIGSSWDVGSSTSGTSENAPSQSKIEQRLNLHCLHPNRVYVRAANGGAGNILAVTGLHPIYWPILLFGP